MRRTVAALALTLGLGVGLAACGIPQEAKPRMVDDRDVPFALLEPSTTTTRP